MKGTTIEYYKKAVRLAEGANSTIDRARADYEHGCKVAKGVYEADFCGLAGVGEPA